MLGHHQPRHVSPILARAIDSPRSLHQPTMFEEGIYHIKSAVTAQCLTLDLGGMHLRKDLRCRDKSSDHVEAQRWMIVRVPGSDEWYSIINLYWGLFVGVHESKYTLTTTAVSAKSEFFHWDLKQQDGAVSFVCRNQDRGIQALALKDGQRNSACQIFDLAPGDTQKASGDTQKASGDTQHWILDRDETCQPGPFSKWMAQVPQDTFLSQLSIPATHQTTAVNNHPLLRNAACQRRSVYQQLLDGIRILDLRFGRLAHEDMTHCLHAIHGPTRQYVSLGAVFQALKLFLTQCPSETVVIKPRNEDASEGFYELFLADFEFFVNASPSMFLVRKGETRMCDISLEQASGKIIVLIAAEGAGQLPSGSLEDPYIKYWTPEREFWGNSGNYMTAGMYNMWLPHQWRNNFDDCRANIRKAVEDDNREHVYSTFWNVSGVPGCRSDPKDFAKSAKKWIASSYGVDVVGVGASKHRSGLSWFDFYDEVDEIRDIIRSNPGCGGLT